jgi:hypothetical protein
LKSLPVWSRDMRFVNDLNCSDCRCWQQYCSYLVKCFELADGRSGLSGGNCVVWVAYKTPPLYDTAWHIKGEILCPKVYSSNNHYIYIYIHTHTHTHTSYHPVSRILMPFMLWYVLYKVSNKERPMCVCMRTEYVGLHEVWTQHRWIFASFWKTAQVRPNICYEPKWSYMKLCETEEGKSALLKRVWSQTAHRLDSSWSRVHE